MMFNVADAADFFWRHSSLLGKCESILRRADASARIALFVAFSESRWHSCVLHLFSVYSSLQLSSYTQRTLRITLSCPRQDHFDEMMSTHLLVISAEVWYIASFAVTFETNAEAECCALWTCYTNHLVVDVSLDAYGKVMCGSASIAMVQSAPHAFSRSFVIVSRLGYAAVFSYKRFTS